MKWLEPWRLSIKNHSQQIFSLIALLPFAFLSLPQSWQNIILEHRWVVLVFSLLAMLGFVLRNRKQANKHVANADAKVFENDG
jgi:hypothetical protein